MRAQNSFLKNYGFSLLLLSSIALGSLLGFQLKEKAAVVKPMGDIFLNLLFTLVVPLVFFSICSAVAGMASGPRLRRIMGFMVIIFVLTGAVAAIFMIVGVKIYPPAVGVQIALPAPPAERNLSIGEQLVGALTVRDFAGLFSKENMLALIFISVLVGVAASKAGEKGQTFVQFLNSGNAVMTRLMRMIMWYAPIGLAAYFAVLMGELGQQLFGSYIRLVKLYFPMALLYFFAAFSLYAVVAAGTRGLGRFWKHIIPPAVTACGTGSSVATIPVSLQAAERIGIPRDIREVVIPVGATIHMEGSCLSAIIKIAFVFGIFGKDFSGADVMLGAIGVAILSGTVMSGIPGGGFLGEMLIVSMYHLPPEALPLLSAIGVIVDAPATMVNACGDNVAAMLVARILGGRNWLPENSTETPQHVIASGSSSTGQARVRLVQGQTIIPPKA